MRFVIAAVCALAVAVAVGQLLSDASGLVAIAVGGKVVRMSLSVAVVLAVLAMLAGVVVITLLWRVLTLRRRWRAWRALRRERRSLQHLADGVLALAAGDYPRAERLLARTASTTAAHYLAAAQAAQAQAAPDRRDRYLALARELAPREAIAISAQQVEMQLGAGDLDGAGQALAVLERDAPDHKLTLGLRHRLLAAREDWGAVAGLLPQLKRARVYPPARLLEVEAESAAHLLAGPHASRAELSAAWDKLGKPTRAIPVVIAAYARDLMRLDDHAEAERMLGKALDHEWESRLVALYGELELATPAAAVRRAERWLTQHQQDPVLLLALGRLCLRAQLWGKARGYLEASLAMQASSLGHRLLADALDRLGEPDAAARQRQRGLDLATANLPALTAT